MTTRITGIALECYVLTCLNVCDMQGGEMYGAQILRTTSPRLSIDSTEIYVVLNKLATEGKIIKRPDVQNGVYCEPCRITPLGKKWLKSFLKA